MIKTMMTIMTHTSFMDRTITSTVRIFDSAVAGDMSRVESEMENRERLIAILQKLQDLVSLNIENMTKKDKAESDEIIKAWSHDLANWIETVSDLDDEITKVLQQLKDKTTEEISATYQNHNKFKGYNLNNVK